ncbi:MAG: cyclohydrolase [Pseudomonadota bacterium]
MSVEFVESCKLPTPFGMFVMHGFFDNTHQKEHIVLTLGEIKPDQTVLVRIHSECLTGDGLFSLRCDCGAQLQSALYKISVAGSGAVFYLRQEGRGIGLLNKIRAYHLQDQGADTVEANEHLGFAADLRDYSMLGPMFAHLNIKRVKLLTNNPKKIKALEELGIEIETRLAHETGRNSHNHHYLDTKKDKLGHLLVGE